MLVSSSCIKPCLLDQECGMLSKVIGLLLRAFFCSLEIHLGSFWKDSSGKAQFAVVPMNSDHAMHN